MLIVGARRWVGEVLLVVVVVAVDLFVSGGERVTRSGAVLPWAVVPVLVMVVHTTLLLRWRRPGLVLSLQCCLALVGLLLPDVQLFVGVLVALHAVARTAPRRRSVAALCACAPVFVLHSINATRFAPAEGKAIAFVFPLVLWVPLVVAVWGFGCVALTAQQRGERARELRALEVVREERLRLARELHDVVSAGVSAMVLHAAGAQALTCGCEPRVGRALEVIEGAGGQTMDELHQMLRLLRTSSDTPSGAWDAPRASLTEVPHLVARACEGGLDARLVVRGDPVPVDPGVDLAGYRLVQEALTNATKHAGAGARVSVELAWGEHLEVRVQDTGGVRRRRPGVGSRLSSGHGLLGLAERVALVGGHLETRKTTDGYLVYAELPVRAGGPTRSGAVDGQDAA